MQLNKGLCMCTDLTADFVIMFFGDDGGMKAYLFLLSIDVVCSE